jgi:hypothetical protein
VSPSEKADHRDQLLLRAQQTAMQPLYHAIPLKTSRTSSSRAAITIPALKKLRRRRMHRQWKKIQLSDCERPEK